MAGAFAQKFETWMPHTIKWESFTGFNDDYGHPFRLAPVDLKCRIDEKVRRVRDANGEEKVSTTMLYVLGGPMDVKDRITLPDTVKGPKQPPILTVSNQWDKTEFSHSEVYL